MKPTRLARLLFATVLLPATVANATVIVNGGFETGNLTGWTRTEASFGVFPNLPAGANVYGAGVIAPGGWPFFVSAPSEGSYAFLNAFDGPGPTTTSLAQSVLVTADAPVIAFQYRAAWSIGVSIPATMDRIFDVNVVSGGVNYREIILAAVHGDFLPGACGPSGCNAPLGWPGFQPDTGLLNGTVDLTPFVGQSVSLVFEWQIPERFTGPGFFQLDNIRAEARVVPEPTSLALLALGVAGLALRRRER